MTWFIYGLADPTTMRIRYVGKSRDPKDRMYSHVSKSAAKPVRDWVASLGSSPVLVIISEHENEIDALAAEEREIKHRSGLLNSLTARCMTTGSRSIRFSGLGNRVRALRVAKTFSAKGLEKAAGLSAGIISRLESGERDDITASSAVLLAKTLGTTVEYLVTGESS